MSDLVLRDAVAGDAPAIAALHADSWRRHYRGAYADAYLDGDIHTERLAVWSARLTEPGPGQLTVVAHSGPDLAGFVHVALDADPQWGSLVDNLHVAPRRHRLGIGTALLSEAARRIATTGATRRMWLWVHEQNIDAQAFYAARHGRPVERRPVDPPGGVPERLAGAPMKLRYAWADAAEPAFPRA